jgi:hypothetical protein
LLAFHSGCEADHSPPSSADVKEWVELYFHSTNTPSWRGAQLGGAQGQLYSLTLPYPNAVWWCVVRFTLRLPLIPRKLTIGYEIGVI